MMSKQKRVDESEQTLPHVRPRYSEEIATMKKSMSHKKDNLPSKPIPRSTLEQKMGSMGTLAGRAMDKVVSAPGNIVQSAATVANETGKKASQVAQDVSTRLDPDEPTKD